MIDFLILSLWIIPALLVCILHIRIDSVSDYRMNLLWEDNDSYKRLPSFETMLFQFWKPLDSFLDKE